MSPAFLFDPTMLLLLQIAVILALCRFLHGAFRRIGQPPVVGEMLAGLLLGPSLLGWIAPSWYQQLFPPDSLPALNWLSQIGLVLFMFPVGLRLDLGEVRAHRHVAGLAGLLSIAVPFAAGLALASPLHAFAPQVPMLPFSLFLGVSMSITAFPVLARILKDEGLAESRLGHVAITCAALNDTAAWTLLAGIAAWTPTAGNVSIWSMIGTHAFLGAFLVGVFWPRGPVSPKLETPMTFLLPLVFSYTGIRTDLGLLGGNWPYAALIIITAVASKVGGAFLGGVIMRFGARDSLALGALLNTRGLVALIALNVGLDLGILSPALFSMLVLMALITTLMTVPLLRCIRYPEERGQK